MEDKDKIAFVNEMIALTKDLSVQHGQHLSDHSAWVSLNEIVRCNYPKCFVKYITDQNWRV